MLPDQYRQLSLGVVFDIVGVVFVIVIFFGSDLMMYLRIRLLRF